MFSIKINILKQLFFEEGKNELEQLYDIERNIINKFITYKKIYNKDAVIFPTYCIKNQFKLNYIKVFKNSTFTNVNLESPEIFIKISGIWQTDNNVGITFKFI